MNIEHIALYVRDLEGARAFFETYFEAQSNSLYHNPKTGFSSYFLSFADGARLEIMTKASVDQNQLPLERLENRINSGYFLFDEVKEMV